MTVAQHPAGRSRLGNHFRHHVRFYGAMLAGILIGLVGTEMPPAERLMLAGDGFFLLYLGLVTAMGLRLTPTRMRHRASFEDVGIAPILAITVVAIGVSLLSIFGLLNDGTKVTVGEIAFAIVSLLLGWLTLHTVVAFHYAHTYYRRAKDPNGHALDARGLEFPGTPEPTLSDFLYFSVVIGMTAQVSDVQISSSRIRRIALVHGMLSFLFNTLLLALAVNVAASAVH